MPIEITMPRLSDTMEEGTLVKWRVQVGSAVANGDILADIETDKATMELTSYDDGTVAQLLVQEGQTLPVGQLIMTLAQQGESPESIAKTAATPATDSDPQPSTDSPSSTAPPDVQPTLDQAAPTTPADRPRVSPVARKIAQEYRIDLALIQGSGPAGRIIKRDVLAAINTPATSTPSGSTDQSPAAALPTPSPQPRLVPLSAMRKTIARRLVESKTTIPHFTVTVTVEMDNLLTTRASLNQHLQAQSIKLSVNDFIVRACALALVEHPTVNASWTDNAIQQHACVNVGVAVALPQEQGGGLVVPTIRDAHRKTLMQISTETKTLAKKARSQGLTVAEMSEGTFTVSNLGMLGVEHFEAIINPPQAAILAVGAAIQKPVVRNNQIAIGYEMTCTLSGDHRTIDGAVAAQFLQSLKATLQAPATLLL